MDDHAAEIDSVLRAHARYPWTEFFQWPRTHYVIMRCHGEPVSVFTRDPGHFEACPDLDTDALRAIFNRLHPGDLLRVEHGNAASVTVTRTNNAGTERSMSLDRSRTEIEMSIAPVLGLAFIEIMRTLDAEVPNG